MCTCRDTPEMEASGQRQVEARLRELLTGLSFEAAQTVPELVVYTDEHNGERIARWRNAPPLCYEPEALFENGSWRI